MNDEFELLQELVTGQRTAARETAFTGGVPPPAPARGIDPRHDRYRPREADLAVLTRHALRREQEMQAGVSPTFTVAEDPRLAHHCRPPGKGTAWMSSTNPPTLFHLRSHPWKPDWLPDADQWPVDGPAAAEDLRRDYGEPLPGDPFLHPFASWRSYRCAGQREAVRAVMMAPAGSTLVVNLPTGSRQEPLRIRPRPHRPRGPERRRRPHDRPCHRPGAALAAARPSPTGLPRWGRCLACSTQQRHTGANPRRYSADRIHIARKLGSVTCRPAIHRRDPWLA